MATDGAFLSLYQSESLITHSRGVMDDGDRGVISRAVFFHAGNWCSGGQGRVGY